MQTELHREIKQLEENNWWIVSRKEFLSEIIRKYFKKRSNIINVGCGTCCLTKDIFLNYNIEGVDESKDMIDYCKSKGINAKIGDSNKLPFKSQQFNGVLSLDVIEHIKDDKKAIKEITRVIKKQGMLLLCVPAKKILMRKFSNLNQYSKILFKSQFVFISSP